MSIVESWARLTAVARKAGLDVSEADNPIIGSQVIEREQRRLGFMLHESVRELYQVGGMASDSTRFSLSLPGLEFPPLAEAVDDSLSWRQCSVGYPHLWRNHWFQVFRFGFDICWVVDCDTGIVWYVDWQANEIWETDDGLDAFLLRTARAASRTGVTYVRDGNYYATADGSPWQAPHAPLRTRMS